MPPAFYFIPHTHWEGAVFKTRQEYLEIGLPNILRALRLLQTYPDYRFVLDQVCYVRPFLERYPAEAAAFRQFVAEGRLSLVGGTNVMLDVNMPGGESFIRQVLYGKGYYRRELGVEVTTGWLLDTFGHHAQLPQLLKLAGYRSHWFFRGVPNWEMLSEFDWEGLDGTRIAAYWLPFGYALTYFSPESLPEFTTFMQQQYDSLAPFSQGTERVGLAGADVCAPEEHVPDLVAQFNLQSDMPFELRLATPTEYEAVVERRPVDKPVIRGELNPIFQGAYSSRIVLKQRMRQLEGLLTLAEKLAVLLNWADIRPSVHPLTIWQAWEPMLFNQAHDLMSGVMTDAVYEDTLRSYDFSQRLANEAVQGMLQDLIDHIDTFGDGIPVVVFNPLGWSRTDVAEVEVGFATLAVDFNSQVEFTPQNLELVDPSGKSVPLQILEAENYRDGTLLRARLAFIARDIPAMGCCVYHLRSRRNEGSSAPPEPTVDNLLKNEYYRLEVDPASGAIIRLIVKDGDWSALQGPGNVVAMEEDRGDLWEPYRALDGGSRIAMQERHLPPQPTDTPTWLPRFSTEQATVNINVPGETCRGAVLSEISVTHPFSERGRFQTRVRLYTGLRRIEFRTKILNQDQFVRYRVFFPTAISQGRITHEIPFGAIERSDGIEYPAQNWMDTSNDTHGVTLLNRGLPGNNVADGTLALSLLRSTCIVAYGFFGGYEPGMSSDTGFELGKELTFDYALLPHSGGWQEAGLVQAGLEFNQPLIACTATVHRGRLPARWGFMEIAPVNLILSALKLSEDGRGAVLRLYESTGKAVGNGQIRFTASLRSAEEVNLIEDHLGALVVEEDGHIVRLAFRPFEIKTIKLEFA